MTEIDIYSMLSSCKKGDFMGKVIKLETHKDYMDRALSTTPQNAIFELIWNACDADATEINVSFSRNDMDQIVSVSIVDNGCGIDFSKIEEKFGLLGFSDKALREKTDLGRFYHGRLGQGRYNALSVSTIITWATIYKLDDKYFKYTIEINSKNKQEIVISEIQEVFNVNTGTKVVVELLDKKGSAFNDRENFEKELVSVFAPYLRSYPEIAVNVDNVKINLEEHIEESNNIQFCFDIEGQNYNANLVIIKWRNVKSRGQLYLCDESGTTLEVATRFNYKGVDSYLCSKSFRSEKIAGILRSYNLNPELSKVVDQALEKVKEYFEEAKNDEAYKEILELKKKKIYPYIYSPKTEMEKVEQSQFDILAIEINKIVPQLKNSTQTVKKLTYTLLKEAVKTEPDAFTEILNSIVSLSEEQKDDLAKLLKTTSLSAIIKTSKLLIDRSKFLDALYLMVYDETGKGIKERTQFQKILLDNLWIFGEDYTYGADDISVKNLLKKHIEHLGRKELIPLIPEDGAVNLDRIPDICLFNKYPLSENRFRNLVVEIKRPTKKLGKKEYDQIIDYHDIITQSAAFPGDTTKWHFVLVGRDFDGFVTKRIEEQASYLGKGNVIKTNSSKVTILSWGEIIQLNKAKIEYLTKSLELQVGEESDILQFLHDNYGKYLS